MDFSMARDAKRGLAQSAIQSVTLSNCNFLSETLIGSLPVIRLILIAFFQKRNLLGASHGSEWPTTAHPRKPERRPEN
jgi:hypothetical protein